MYPRTNYEMTEEDESTLLNACKPTMCMGGSWEENGVRLYDRQAHPWKGDAVLYCGSQRDGDPARRKV